MEQLLSPEEYERLRGQLEKRYRAKVLDRKIRAIRVNSSYHWQPKLFIEVGKFCGHLELDGPPEKIMVIYESRSFLVCTPGHGYEGGRPYVFARADVREVMLDD